jgi:hypothetical protein
MTIDDHLKTLMVVSVFRRSAVACRMGVGRTTFLFFPQLVKCATRPVLPPDPECERERQAERTERDLER